MAGRPRKTTAVSTGKIGKEAIMNRKAQEERLKLTRDNLKPPEWLDDAAAKEFQRVVDEAGQIDLLDNLDLGFLAIYANAYSQYVICSKSISEVGLMTKVDEEVNIHPLISVQEKYVKQIMQCSTKLGLATTDRLKLIVPGKEETKENKFLRFVK